MNRAPAPNPATSEPVDAAVRPGASTRDASGAGAVNGPGGGPEDAAPSRVRGRWRRARGPAIVLALVIAAVMAMALSQPRIVRNELDPRAVDRTGSKALAVLLSDEGVRVERVRAVPADAPAGTTVFVPLPEMSGADDLARLRTSGADVVLVAPDQEHLDALDLPLEAARGSAPEERRPACELAVARRAGSAELGGVAYQADDDRAVLGCYPLDGMPALLTVQRDERTITVLGTRQLFTNDHLARSGNAALAAGLLGGNETLLWVRPTAADVVGSEQEKPLPELLPPAVPLALLQALIALAILAIWRGRRLGPVVAEPLPVVVRSVETTEGRGRLYRRAGARDRAAELLRDATRSRLLPALGVPPGAAADAVTASVSAAAGRDPVDVVRLLYGPPPDSDAALLRLATELEELEQEARRP